MLSPWLSFSSGDNRHSVQGKLVNWYIEGSSEEGERLIPTAGLERVVSGLSGPVRGLYQKDNVVGGDLLIVAGSAVYRMNRLHIATKVGTVDAGTDEAIFASTATQTVVLVSGKVYDVTAGTVVPFTVSYGSDTASNIVSVLVANNRFLYVDNSAAGRGWWSAQFAPDDIEGFFTLEASPDGVRTAIEVNNSIAFLGTNTIELWAATSSSTVPFARRPGGVLDKGIYSRDAVTKADFGLFIVGNDAVVYRFSNFSPERISTHGIETYLEDLTESQRAAVKLTSHAWRGHQFIQLDIPDKGTFVYDIATKRGHERASEGQTLYRGSSYVRCFGAVYAGDRYDGNILKFTEEKWDDAGNDVKRIASIFLPVTSGTPKVGPLSLDLHHKNSPAGVNSISLRWSHDRGRNWLNPISRSISTEGDTGHRVIFAPLGRAKSAGILFELSCVSMAGISLGAARIGDRRV